MARSNGSGKNPYGQYDEYTQIMINEMVRQQNEKHYCRICGQELIRTTANADVYQYELQNSVHQECARRYNEEVQEKMAKEYRERMELMRQLEEQKAKAKQQEGQ